jgi:hypothetical protein
MTARGLPREQRANAADRRCRWYASRGRDVARERSECDGATHARLQCAGISPFYIIGVSGLAALVGTGFSKNGMRALVAKRAAAVPGRTETPEQTHSARRGAR